MMMKNLWMLIGVFSLTVGIQGAAQANSASGHNAVESGVVTLWGKSYCFHNAPHTIKCDWRAPSPTQVSANFPRSLTLLGKRWCLGDQAAGHCDHRFPSNTRTALNTKTFKLLGMSVCVGDVSADSKCDLRFPNEAAIRDEREASL